MKFVCTVCGYVYEGDAAPEECPICHAPASKFNQMDEEKAWAASPFPVSIIRQARLPLTRPRVR